MFILCCYVVVFSRGCDLFQGHAATDKVQDVVATKTETVLDGDYVFVDHFSAGENCVLSFHHQSVVAVSRGCRLFLELPVLRHPLCLSCATLCVCLAPPSVSVLRHPLCLSCAILCVCLAPSSVSVSRYTRPDVLFPVLV